MRQNWSRGLEVSGMLGKNWSPGANHQIASCLICCYQSSIPMRLCARLASSELTLLPRSSTTSRTTDSEYLFGAEFFLHRVYPLATTDMGRLCKKPMISALFICKPPL